MDLAKYLSLLQRSALFFVRLDLLTSDDPFEGAYTLANSAVERVEFEQLPPEAQKMFGDKDKYQAARQHSAMSRQVARMQMGGTFVSSWHHQEHESAAMWAQYVRSADGIAIQSTYQRLVDAVSGYGEFGVMAGLIKYLDYHSEIIALGNVMSPFMHKRKSFEHERELRALIWTYENGKNHVNNNKYNDTLGLYVATDLTQLIERIFVSPTAPGWFVEMVEAVTRKYGVNQPVIQSDLASKPLY